LTFAGAQVAGGSQGQNSHCIGNYSVTLNYNFVDDWKYTAETCRLIVTYKLVSP
jgi:hypothetical protein